MKTFNFYKQICIFLFLFFPSSISLTSQKLSIDNKTSLKKLAYFLTDQNIKYGSKYSPPRKKGSLKMDCSNTVKYIYKEALGVKLPRTSFEQYQIVQSSGNFQAVPKTTEGKIDILQLSKKLRVGDLLFWINTHSDIPKAWNPPIGHVMIYMGKSKTKKMVMFGAGTYGEGFKTSSGGVDLYLFDPEMSLGCIKNQKKECIVESEFYGFGKPPLM